MSFLFKRKIVKILIITTIFSSALSLFADDKIAQFTSKSCGQNGNATGLLKSGESVAINGNTDLSNCIQANDDGKIFWINLNYNSADYFKYEVEVEGEGPSGWNSGSMYLRFIDETNDFYDLSLFLSSRGTHEVSYNSDSPNIKAILWSNTSFPTDYFCSPCTDLVDKTLEFVINEATGCNEVGTEFEAECLADAGGPEDLIGDIVCSAGAISVVSVCSSYENFNDFKADLENASANTCKDIDLCD